MTGKNNFFFYDLKKDEWRINYDQFLRALVNKLHFFTIGKDLFIYEEGISYSVKGMDEDYAETQMTQEITDLWEKNLPKDDKGNNVMSESVPSNIMTELRKRINYHHILSRQKLNCEEYLIPCKNGILNLETKQLLAYKPYKYYFTHQFNVNYEPNAKYIKFQAWLEDRIPKAEARSVLQEYSGFLLCKGYDYHKALYLFGEGRNGKDTFINTISDICGGESGVSGLSLNEIDKQFGLINLYGKILNVSSESKSDLFENTELFKKITGQSYCFADRKYKPGVNFKNTTKVIIAGNELPSVNDHSTGFWERWNAVDFAKPIPEGERIKNYYLVLLEERSGIFNWMIEGYEKLRQNGKFTVYTPLLDEWKAQTDKFLQFKQEVIVCTNNVENFIKTTTLFDVFKFWSMICNYKGKEHIGTFCQNMKRLGLIHKKTNESNGFNCIKLQKSVIDEYTARGLKATITKEQIYESKLEEPIFKKALEVIEKKHLYPEDYIQEIVNSGYPKENAYDCIISLFNMNAITQDKEGRYFVAS